MHEITLQILHASKNSLQPARYLTESNETLKERHIINVFTINRTSAVRNVRHLTKSDKMGMNGTGHLCP